MSLKEPIVEGACPFCGRSDGLRLMCNHAATMWHVNCYRCGAAGPIRCAKSDVPNRTEASKALALESWKTRAGYLVPTDPAEVVTELRERATRYDSVLEPAIAEVVNEDADLVATKLGVK